MLYLRVLFSSFGEVDLQSFASNTMFKLSLAIIIQLHIPKDYLYAISKNFVE